MREKKLNVLLAFGLVLLLCLHKGQAQYSLDVSGGKWPSNKNPLTKRTLISVLKELNDKKGIYFLLSDESYGNILVNPVKDYNADIEKILNDLLLNTGLGFKKVGNNIYVIRKEASPDKQQESANGQADEAYQDMSLGRTKKYHQVVSGVVRVSERMPLANASVTVKGTRRGTTTNEAGEFSLEVNEGEVLVFSYIGYASREVTVGKDHFIPVTLNVSGAALHEVVVTALGITKEKRSLGFSISEIKGSELTEAREINVAHSLTGKVAGMNVHGVSGGPGSSANVIIRGVSSLDPGQTQPLYVVNGIPVNNQIRGNGGGQYANSADLGDGIQNINPDDIETITVLKGAAAAALYGSRAKAGVILITSKSGSSGGKGTIELNSNVVADDVMDLTDWQYEYGQGTNNLKPVSGTAAFQAGNASWGARIDGTSVMQFDSIARPYIAHKNNIKNFYRRGYTLTNTVSFSKGLSEGGGLRVSASYLRNQSPLPNSGLERYNMSVALNTIINKHLSIDTRVNYINDVASNRPLLADGAGNVNFQVMFLPTTVNVNDLKPGWKADGSERQFTNNAFATNPWFAAHKFINNTNRNRYIASGTLRYTLAKGYFLQWRVGMDMYNDRHTTVIPNGTAFYAQAAAHITELFSRVTELNTDFLIGKTFTVKKLTITPNLGGNLRKSRSEGTLESGTNFVVPFVYNILNAKNKTISHSHLRQDIQSLYGMVEIAYNKRLYVTASGRKDWFSTLAPSNDLGIFYPSFSGSFVFSEYIKHRWLNFGKLRAGWANVGGGIHPYQTLLNYGVMPQQLNGLPLGTIMNTAIPNRSLRPSNATEMEIGTEWRLFNNRLAVDFSVYNKKSNNEIIAAPASTTSGFSGVILNLGELRNKGVELQLTHSVILKKSFKWIASFNGSVNDNKVVSLAAGQSSLSVATSRTATGFIQNRVGMATNQIMAFDYSYGADGKILYDASGAPVRGDLKPWGSAYAKYTAGWNNEFTYRKLSLSVLLDGKFGGRIFSATNHYGFINGLHKKTLENREGSFGSLQAQAYYAALANNISKLFVYDASFIKLRQLMLSYSLPSGVGKVIKGATISLVGRNLFFLMRRTENFDPEASYGNIAQGLELGGVPPVRNYGVNLHFKL